jgi:hypothetical protein
MDNNNNQMVPPTGEGGPQISGKWYNPHNGNVVYIRDSLIDGDCMYVITDKGRISLDELQAYVQVEEDDVLPDGPIVNMPTTDIKSQLAASGMNAGDLSADNDIFVDKSIVDKSHNEVINDTQNSVATITIPEHDKSYIMIDKIFSKTNIVPKIKLVIDNNTFPYAELGMLMEYFDVTADDIAEYVKDKFITGDAVKESIGNHKE